MWTIPKEIKRVVRELCIGNDLFRRLDERREHKVLQDVKRHFLSEVNAPFWWKCFRYESATLVVENARRLLPRLCPNEEKKVWFIPCEEGGSVYDTFPHIAVRVLEQCPVFEYALVDKKLKWMFLVNHHNVIFATGLTAMQRLVALDKGEVGVPASSPDHRVDRFVVTTDRRGPKL